MKTNATSEMDIPVTMTAKISGSAGNRHEVTYIISENTDVLCFDRKELLLSQLFACRKLLKYAEPAEKSLVEKEISDLQNALDLIQ